MKNEEIFGIINYINSLTFSEFELETNDIKIKVVRDTTKHPDGVLAASNYCETAKTPSNDVPESNLPSVDAPITGVFYRAPAPGEAAFVQVGDRVQKGDTLCILEAMKMMNEVKSDKSGIIKEILITDGDSVEESTKMFVFQGE